jgi:hypothetical protein
MLEVELKAAEARTARGDSRELPGTKAEAGSLEGREAGILNNLDSLSEEDIDRLLKEMLKEEENVHDY